MIYITVGDVGDAAALAPVIRQLRGKAEVNVFADPHGEGKTVLAKNRILFTQPQYPLLTKEGSRSDGRPLDAPGLGRSQTLLVCGTSGKAQTLHLNAMREAKKRNIPVIGLEDFYLTSCAKKLRRAPYDHLIVMDEDEKANVLRVRKDLKPSQVHALGQPAFDDIPALRRTRNVVRRETRERLGIGPGETVVVFYCAASYQIDIQETLDPLLQNLPSTVTLIPQFHPADPKGRWWVNYVNNHFEGKTVHPLLNKEGVPPGGTGVRRTPGARAVSLTDRDSLSLAADLVISQYNTAAIRSSLLGVPTLFTIFKSVRKYLEKRGLRKSYFPQLNPQHPIALAAFNTRSLKRHLAALLHHPAPAMRSFACHQRHFRKLTDGRATERVVKFICECLTRQ